MDRRDTGPRGGEACWGYRIYIDLPTSPWIFLFSYFVAVLQNASPTQNVDCVCGAFRNSWDKSTDSTFEFNSLWVISIGHELQLTLKDISTDHFCAMIHLRACTLLLLLDFFHTSIFASTRVKNACALATSAIFTAINKSISRRSRQLSTKKGKKKKQHARLLQVRAQQTGRISEQLVSLVQLLPGREPEMASRSQRRPKHSSEESKYWPLHSTGCQKHAN